MSLYIQILMVAVCAMASGAGPSQDKKRILPNPLPHKEEPQDAYRPAVIPAGGAPLRTHPRAPAGSVQVNVDGAGLNIIGDAANEPSITTDPTNPNRLAIGWRQFDTIASNFRQAGFGYSTDAGQTWTFPGTLQPGIFRSDPILGADGFGTLYYNSLQGNFCIDVWRSTDGGATWPNLAPISGGDKAWMDVDRRIAGAGAGHLYSSWSFGAPCNNQPGLFTRSTDGGLSWLTPIDIPNTPVFGTLAVGPDGELYVAGVTFPTFFIDEFSVARSSNARNPGATPVFESSVAGNFLGGALLGAGSQNPDGLMGQVGVGVNPSSGPARGHVYLLCSVDPPGSDPLDIMFSRSTDRGVTWSAPVRVNDDSPSNGATQWFGTMSVAPNGRIDVIWNDTRDDTPTNGLSRVYYSYSVDEGVTWTANVALTPQFDSLVGFPQQAKLGDYYDMESDLTGAHLAYAATFNGEQDVYYMHIVVDDCDADGTTDADEILGGADDCNSNGVPDSCENDCDSDGVPDACEVTPVGPEPDCNSNGVPDGCEPDCNSNGIPDECDVPPLGAGADCNGNYVPDECDPQDDCNSNGIADICDLANQTSQDCNNNDLPDECDVPPIGAGNDCNFNLIPDECEPQTDCNGNLVADICDIGGGSSLDCNSNGTPDECEFDVLVALNSFSFESGTLPAGWLSTGLWHISSLCPRASVCNGSKWAYYGQDTTCNFNTPPSANSGVMTAASISIPANAVSATLRYCSAYIGQGGNSNVAGLDWAWVSINGVEADDVSASGVQSDWEERTVNLSAFIGQSITLRWHFDSRSAVLNTLLGWQVDGIVVEAVIDDLHDCNGNGLLDSCEVEDGLAADCNQNGILDECEGSVPCTCGATVYGDLDGNSLVNGNDIDEFVLCLLNGDPQTPGCECADMNQNGVINDVDTTLFVKCLISEICP